MRSSRPRSPSWRSGATAGSPSTASPLEPASPAAPSTVTGRIEPRLIADAIDALNVQPEAGPADAESPRERISALLHHLSDAMRTSPVSACLPALIDGAERDGALRRLHHRYSDRRRAALVAAIAAAIEAGDLRDDIDPELAATALAGAIIYRRLMTGRPLPADEVDPLIDTVLGAPPAGAAVTLRCPARGTGAPVQVRSTLRTGHRRHPASRPDLH